MSKGASASQTGPSQAEPEVSALRASVPCADDISDSEWEVIHALSSVTIGQVSDGGPLYWGVWDQNMKNDEEDFGWVHIGREVEFGGERYEPISAAPGKTHWAWQQARARAVLRLFDRRAAIATEAGTAATEGAVHEGAGRKASPKPSSDHLTKGNEI